MKGTPSFFRQLLMSFDFQYLLKERQLFIILHELVVTTSRRAVEPINTVQLVTVALFRGKAAGA
jgi:hypothetical protein